MDGTRSHRNDGNHTTENFLEHSPILVTLRSPSGQFRVWETGHWSRRGGAHSRGRRRSSFLGVWRVSPVSHSRRYRFSGYENGASAPRPPPLPTAATCRQSCWRGRWL